MQYDFLNDSFTTFENVETPKVTLNMPLADNPLDISDWSDRITSNGIPIVKDNINTNKENNESKLIVNNNQEQSIKNEDSNEQINLISKSKKEASLQIMNGLIKRGFKPHQAAGIVGNLMAESSLNTGSINPNDLGLPAGGLAGWRGENFSKLKAFANSQGKSWKDIDSQLDFLTSSISSDVKDKLISSKNPHEASEAWAYYERYAGYDGTTKTAKKAGWSQSRVDKEHRKRSDYAKEFYELWKSQQA